MDQKLLIEYLEAGAAKRKANLAITDGGCVDYLKLAYFDPIINIQGEK